MIGVIGSCRYFELSDDGGGVAVSYSPFLMDGGGHWLLIVLLIIGDVTCSYMHFFLT